MKIIYYSIILVLILVVCPSCNKEVKNLQEEIKSLRNENNFLKADNIALRKELEEVYKRIDEKDLIKQKPVARKTNKKRSLRKTLRNKNIQKANEEHL